MEDVGICYICKENCNPSSQTCGRCARNLTMDALGWDRISTSLKGNALSSITRNKKAVNNQSDEDTEKNYVKK